MPFSQALLDQVSAKRDEFDALIAKEEPTEEDQTKASTLDAEIAKLEDRLAEAQRLEAAADTRRKQDRTPMRLINTGGKADKSDYSAELQRLNEIPKKSWFDAFVETSEFKSAVERRDFRYLKVDLPNHFTAIPGRAGYKAAGDPIMASQFATRLTDYTMIAHPFPPIGVVDLINVVNVTAANVRYYAPTVPLTNTAAFIAEGTVKPEMQPRWAPVDAPIETVADWTAVTLQALDDVPQLRSVIDFDLRMGVESTLDNQILNGSGTSPQLKGILGTAGVQNVAFVASTSAPDMIAKGIAAIQSTGNGQPNGVVMNPADFWSMRLTKAPGSGVYYFGSPTDVGASNLFGVTVVQDPNLAAGTALVGDWRYATLYQRLGITFIVGLKNDDLIKNLQTIVCEMRCALAVRRPAAFAKVALV